MIHKKYMLPLLLIGSLITTKQLVAQSVVSSAGASLSSPTGGQMQFTLGETITTCLLYTSPSPRDQRGSRMPSSA